MTYSGRTISILEKIGKPKWPPTAILCKYDKKACAIQFKMEIKMATGGHFEQFFFKKLRIDLKWREIRSKVMSGHPKWRPAAIL